MEKLLDKLFEIDTVTLFQVITGCLLIYLSVIALTRLFGLRSFSKMSGFDFAKTIAIGSMIGSVATTNTTFINGLIALSILYLLHQLISMFRQKKALEKIVDNRPKLLMYNGKIHKENLRKAKVSEDDLRAKLREANILQYDQVRAVVMETTGTITVLHSADKLDKLDPDLLKGVAGLPMMIKENQTKGQALPVLENYA